MYIPRLLTDCTLLVRRHYGDEVGDDGETRQSTGACRRLVNAGSVHSSYERRCQCWQSAPVDTTTAYGQRTVGQVSRFKRLHNPACCPTRDEYTQGDKKVAHTRLPSVGFRSWSCFLAVSLQETWVINPAVGCHYFPPCLQLRSQPDPRCYQFSCLVNMGTMGVNSLHKTVTRSVAAAIWTQALLRLSQAR